MDVVVRQMVLLLHSFLLAFYPYHSTKSSYEPRISYPGGFSCNECWVLSVDCRLVGTITLIPHIRQSFSWLIWLNFVFDGIRPTAYVTKYSITSRSFLHCLKCNLGMPIKELRKQPNEGIPFLEPKIVRNQIEFTELLHSKNHFSICT